MKSISFERAVEIALEQHQAGNFSRAEGLYLEILRQDPGNVDALHLLGVLAHQGHQPESAVQLIQAAIRKKPDVAVFHYNLAESLLACGRMEEAIAEYRRAIELAPLYFEAHNNLGNALFSLKRFAEAEVACRKAIELQSDSPLPLNNLGNALRGLLRSDEAEGYFRQAIALRPDFVEAINNLAMCLCTLGRYEEGIEQFRKAIHLDPAAANIHNNLGAVFSAMGKHIEAGASYETAVRLNPNHAEANNNLGASLRELGKPQEAIPFFRKAIEIEPKFVSAHCNLAMALKDAGQRDEALESLDIALKMRPRLALQHFQRGMILRELHRMDEALEALKEAHRLDPANIDGITSLGYAMLERGELDAATQMLEKSLERNPDPQSFSNVLLTVNYHPKYSPADLIKLHRRWSELHEEPLAAECKPHANNRDPDRRLRIGYVSPDFRGHSVAYFLAPILDHHDRKQFEVFGYSHVVNTDLQTWRLRSEVDHWRETSSKPAAQIAEQIRTDQIDILIDLAGHTGGNLLPVFALKPAPVQINMIGFPSTTGLTAMDYRITDPLCDPPGVSDELSTEKLIRMPQVFWVYLPPVGFDSIGNLPADDNRFITFTSVNNFTKVTPYVQDLWAKVLLAVPNSRLIMQTGALNSEFTQTAVKDRFNAHGVNTDRLEFRNWSDFPQYMKLLERSDMTLDPFPFNGGTTTCHSLWMGAPVITLAGDRHAFRMGLSMMTAIGLPQFVAYTPEEYVQIALKMANDLPQLREIRMGMRDRLKASPLLDAAGYTRDLETAFRTAWKKWCLSGT